MVSAKNFWKNLKQNTENCFEMKAWQRQIREKRKAEDLDADMFGQWWKGLNISIESASVEKISYQQASEVITKYEWLGNMGTTEESFGLICDSVIVGVVCFGRTAGTSAASAVFGESAGINVMTLCRGACVHYAPEHSASFLISSACKQLAQEGTNGFISYADPQAGEIGTVYQACGWIYTGVTSPTEKFITPDGEVKDARLVSAYTRDRRNGTLTYKRTRKEQKELMLESGHEFFTGHAKHRYVGVYGTSASHTRKLRKQVLYSSLPYPKRVKSQERESDNQSEGQGQFLQPAPPLI